MLLDGDSAVVDSWTIASYLEDTYPDRPSLFGGEGGRAMGRMLNWWGDGVIAGMAPLIVADIPLNLKPEDAAYFRRSREARFGRPLEEVVASRDKSVEGFRKSLDPLRLTLRTAVPRRRCCELCGLHRVRRVPVGAGGEPVQAACRGRSSLFLARTAAGCLRRPRAQVAELSRVAAAQPAQPFPITRSPLTTVATIWPAAPLKSSGFR